MSENESRNAGGFPASTACSQADGPPDAAAGVPRTASQPFGVVPKFVHDQQRYDDLLRAVNQFREGKYIIPPEWFKELHQLAQRIRKRRVKAKASRAK